MWIVLKCEGIIIIAVVQLHYFDFHSAHTHIHPYTLAQCEKMLRWKQPKKNIAFFRYEFRSEWIGISMDVWLVAPLRIQYNLFCFIERIYRRPWSVNRTNGKRTTNVMTRAKITCHFVAHANEWISEWTNNGLKKRIACGIARELKHTVSGARHGVEGIDGYAKRSLLINWLKCEVHSLRNQTEIGKPCEVCEMREFVPLVMGSVPATRQPNTMNYHLLFALYDVRSFAMHFARNRCQLFSH